MVWLELQPHSAAQADLKFMIIFLPNLLTAWDYKISSHTQLPQGS